MSPTTFVVCLALFGLVEMIGIIFMIGKPREPVTPGYAVFHILFWGALVWGVWTYTT